MNALAQIQPKLESAVAETQFENMEAIGRLVSGVAHDFNNLLTGVVLCSDLLLAGLEKQSPLRRYAQEIRGAAAQGSELVRQLMEVARQSAVTANLLSLNEVIARLRSLLMRVMGEDIELITHLADDLAVVKMERVHAQQIILNLLLNARDAMPDGGSITVATRNCGRKLEKSEPTPGEVELEVSDTGCGMDAETRARAFQLFFSTKKPAAGSGLGLATVSRIVQLNGGTILMESEPGRGTRVVVRLPAWLTAPAVHEAGEEIGTAPAPERQIETRGKQV